MKYTPVGGSGDTITVQTRNNATKLTISGLVERLVYEVSIAAKNSQGTGPAIVATIPTMGKSLYAPDMSSKRNDIRILS